MDSTLRLSARAGASLLNWHSVAILRPAVSVEVVPDLAQLRATIVKRAVAGSGLVVARARAAKVRRDIILLPKSLLHLGERIGRLVGGRNAVVREPVVGRQTLEVLDGSLEEVDEVVVLDILGTVARDVEG